MKILVDGLPRTTGGIGTLIINIVNYNLSHTDNNIEFEFLISETTGYLDYLKSINQKYYIAPSLDHFYKYFVFLVKLFSNNQYDYLWFNNTSKVNVFLPLLAKTIGKAKIISHSHGVKMEESGIKRYLFYILEKINSNLMYSLIDIPFACSQSSADYYYDDNQNMRLKTRIISNGIDTDLFKYSVEKRCQIRDELGIKEDEVLLGAVGRLTAVKNYSFIIQLLEALDSNYKVIILGDGELKRSLNQSIIDSDLLDRCFLLGNKSNVQDYLSAMDVFLMPSLHEGFPFSLVEAQCAGLPCIVSSSVSKETKITDLVSYLPIDSIEEWANTIKNIDSCNNRCDYYSLLKRSDYDIGNTYTKFVSSISKVKK